MAYYPKERNATSVFFHGQGGSDQVLETNANFYYTSGTNTVYATTFDGVSTGLSSAVTVQVNGEMTGIATFQEAGDTANIGVTAQAELISNRTVATVANADDTILLLSGTSLRQITKGNFVSDLGGGTMSDFIFSGDGGPGQTIEQGNTALIAGGVGLQTTASATDTVTVDITGVHGGLLINGTVVNDKLTNSSFSLDGDLGTTEIVSLGDTMSILGGSGISTTASVGENVTVNLTDTAVTAGSYGSSSAVGTFTVDANGRLTAASDVNIDGTAISNNTFTIQGDVGTTDTVALGQTFDIAGGSGIETSRDGTRQVTINLTGPSITSGTLAGGSELPSDVNVIDVAGGSEAYTLPVTPPEGQTVRVKKSDPSANTITVSGSAGKYIDGGTSYILYNQFESVTFISDSNGWYVF